MYANKPDYWDFIDMDKWQQLFYGNQPSPSQLINCYLPYYAMNNEHKCNQENASHILKTALTHGSAVALKNYQIDASEHVTTSNNQFAQDANQAERVDSLPIHTHTLSSQNQKSMMPITHNKQFLTEWNTQYAGEADSFPPLSSNQQLITATYNNQSTYNGIGKESNFSSNPITYESSQEYQQQNIQNNYGQNHVAHAQFNNYMNDTCMGPLTVSDPIIQQESMQHTIHRVEQKSKYDHKKEKLTYTDDIEDRQKRRTRQTYSADQTFILEQAFQTNEYVTRKMRMALAQKTNLCGRQIKIWFQNRRMKEKRNNPARILKTDTAIHETQASTLSNEEAQPQLQPIVQHHEGYQNYPYNHQHHQQNNIINQPSYFFYK